MAQNPVANFTSSVTTGCAPLVVTFTDQSTGNPKFWNWEFGNGQLSTVQNPTIVYGDPGVYTVRLVVRNADGTDGITKTNYIVVTAAPFTNFSSNVANGCVPSVVQFTDLSTTATGNIVSWNWDFGDGTTSTAQHPTHTYTANGFYTVGLTVKNSAGCEGGVTRVRFIRIVSGVTADFSNATPVTCRPPFAIDFKNETSGPGTLTYTWNLGNGNTSSDNNPSAVYNTSGNYTVQLIASSSFGCSDSITKEIAITGNATNFTGPDSTCINSEISFTNSSSTPPNAVTWDFGDGNTSTALNATHRYATAGTYTVKMINVYDDCTDSVSKTVTVNPPPVISFSSDKVIACQAPFQVNFEDNTLNGGTWAWEFGDGGTSTQRNPSHTFTAAGDYNVKLTVTDVYGCTNDTTRNAFIRIVPPVITSSNVNAGGCIPFTYQPTATASSFDGIANYSWDLGNGIVVNGQTPGSFVYPTQATYTITLTVTTNQGCSVTETGVLRTGTPPTPAFIAQPASACASPGVTFTNTTPGGAALEYLWDFGDGTGSRDVSLTHMYADTGTFAVKLIAVNNGCQIPVTQSVHVKPPVADFDFQVDCATGNRVSFTNTSKTDAAYGPVTYSWNFGDGSPVSNAANPVHQFPSIAVYTVSLTVKNDTCSYTVSKTINLVVEPADFSISKASPVCRNEVVVLSAINSKPENVQKYSWIINGDTLPIYDRSFRYNFASNGQYSVVLHLSDSNGCSNTSAATMVTVTGPRAVFAGDTLQACGNALVTFTDQSIPDQPIVLWEWDFGDSTIQSFAGAPFTHRYNDTGTFDIKLRVSDANGCIDSLSRAQMVTITNPRAAFGADTSLLCPGIAITLKDSSVGKGLTYNWDLGDGSTSTDQFPVHTYSGPDTTFTVRLAVSDVNGCTDTTIREQFIRVLRPKPAFTAIDTSSICPPLETKFFFDGKDFESYYWDFGDSTDISTLKDPTHFYNEYGNFTAKLYLIGYGGCIDSAQHQVIVTNPNNTRFTYDPLSACNELNVTFDIDPPAYTRFFLAYGDGIIDSSQNKTPTYLFGSPGFYYPYLILRDSVGCEAAIGTPEIINIIGAQPLFGIDNDEFCDTGTVYFTDYTIGNDPVVSINWKFGDGNVSGTQHPTHTYTTPGDHVVMLTVVTQTGCTDSITDTVHIYRTPSMAIQSLDTICINSSVTFSGNITVPDSLIQFNWNFGNGSTSTNISPVTTFGSIGDFTVKLDTKVPFGCSATTSKSVHVVPLPEIMATNPTIMAGTGINLPVTYTGNIVNYNWTPANSLDCSDCAVPFAKPGKTTTYKVTATDVYGCSNTTDVTVFVVCSEKNLFVPNTFSPNNDGNNDVFYPRGSGLTRIQNMRIFNRWGQTVFHKSNFAANDPTGGWNGTFNGKKLDPDVYVYTIDVLCENGEVFPFKGNVMLLK
jgi:gliding motility-associated-like protein